MASTRLGYRSPRWVEGLDSGPVHGSGAYLPGAGFCWAERPRGCPSTLVCPSHDLLTQLLQGVGVLQPHGLTVLGVFQVLVMLHASPGGLLPVVHKYAGYTPYFSLLPSFVNPLMLLHSDFFSQFHRIVSCCHCPLCPPRSPQNPHFGSSSIFTPCPSHSLVLVRIKLI